MRFSKEYLWKEIEKLQRELKEERALNRAMQEHVSLVRRELGEEIRMLREANGFFTAPEDAKWVPTEEIRLSGEGHYVARVVTEINGFGAPKKTESIAVPVHKYQRKYMRTWGEYEWRDIPSSSAYADHG